MSWMSYTTANFPLCFAPHVMDHIRDVCRHHLWDEFCSLATALLAEIKLLTKTVSDAIRFPVPRCSSGTIVWTDASTSAIGILTQTPNRGYSVALPCSSSRIFLAELLAGIIASLIHQPHAWTWAVDNAAAAAALIKGHSGNAFADFMLRCWIETRFTPNLVTRIPSACQLADPLTRVESHIRPCGSMHESRPPRWVLPHEK
jgi:hypothetical protein